MATVEEEEAEYDNDSEEVVLQLTMRRREASDDDDDDEYGEAEYRERRSFRTDWRAGICSDGESDGLGGAPEYDDEESYIDEEDKFEEEDELEEVVEELQEFEEKGIEAVPVLQIKEKKKESEPFVIPTLGAFYMHDDRFRDNGRGGRHRLTLGGRKLWQSKDEQKWGHDKFEDLTLQQARNKEFNTFIEESRAAKGHYRGRSSNRGRDCGHVNGNQSRHHDKSNNQSHSSKVVRGRGPVKYKPLMRSNNVIPPTKNKQTGRSQVAKSNTISARVLLHTSNKRDVQPGSINRHLPTSVMPEENFSVPQSNAFLQGKTIVDSIGQNRPYIEGSICPVAGNRLTNLPLPSSVTQSTYMAECSQSRVQRRVLPISAWLSNQSTPSSNEVDRVSSQTQHPVIQRRPVESMVQPSLRVSTKQLSLGRGSGSQASLKALSPNSFEPGQLESLPGSSRSKLALFGNRRGIAQGSGRGSLPYSGTHVDNNFPASPTLFPVMQYGGQHHGGLGVPAVFPGYTSQSQLGFENSEMTCNETGTNRLNSGCKPPDGPELVNEEYWQQQIKPRRQIDSLSLSLSLTALAPAPFVFIFIFLLSLCVVYADIQR